MIFLSYKEKPPMTPLGLQSKALCPPELLLPAPPLHEDALLKAQSSCSSTNLMQLHCAGDLQELMEASICSFWSMLQCISRTFLSI